MVSAAQLLPQHTLEAEHCVLKNLWAHYLKGAQSMKHHVQLKQMQRVTRNSQQACHTELTSCGLGECISSQQEVEVMEESLNCMMSGDCSGM